MRSSTSSFLNHLKAEASNQQLFQTCFVCSPISNKSTSAFLCSLQLVVQSTSRLLSQQGTLFYNKRNVRREILHIYYLLRVTQTQYWYQQQAQLRPGCRQWGQRVTWPVPASPQLKGWRLSSSSWRKVRLMLVWQAGQTGYSTPWHHLT